MIDVIFMSAVSVAACLVTASRVVGWKRLLNHSTKIDVAFTVLLALFMGGTLTGNLVSVMGGLFMALTLAALNYILYFVEHSAAEKPMLDDEHTIEGVWIYNQAPYV
jgi:uncharacterized membrane protein YcaP (DUF421 family)